MTSVIAEIGSNHCGSIDLAHKLVDMCAEAGAHAVKLQKRDNRTLYTKDAYKAPYNSENAYGDTYGEHREALEFGYEEYAALKAHATSKGLGFLATAFDERSVRFLRELGCDEVKIASGSAKDIPLLRYARDSGLRLIVSTGGCSLADVDRIVEEVPDLTLLACTASYPCRAEDLQLATIPAFISRYPGVTVGASMHFNGISMPLAAAALGAQVLEVHVTLDRTMKGTDHAFSLEPQGLERLCRDLQRLDAAMGDGTKRVLDCEVQPIQKMSRAVRVSRDLPACHVLSRDDLCLKSPGDGHPPYMLPEFVGRRLVRPLLEEQALALEDVD